MKRWTGQFFFCSRQIWIYLADNIACAALDNYYIFNVMAVIQIKQLHVTFISDFFSLIYLQKYLTKNVAKNVIF